MHRWFISLLRLLTQRHAHVVTKMSSFFAVCVLQYFHEQLEPLWQIQCFKVFKVIGKPDHVSWHDVFEVRFRLGDTPSIIALVALNLNYAQMRYTEWYFATVGLYCDGEYAMLRSDHANVLNHSALY